ncbi:Predicted heme peroxidase involved in anaerobic stress response [Methylacidimicrobium sp. AP8]|uniref:chlorite dismutase family protein n=1 Tax=Methylacidimicrobium sp. AP8 TaxID=2730359 RepID=UPI0018C0B568|nr:chlorite dismutase family protein [Methylacidimicrobium sp. AP8]CAB4243283.1 Predicted heme peroxidase involved in anaerobic stress response [Methylacidimicrobium sp. AP8]
MNPATAGKLEPKEGLFVLHLFYRFEGRDLAGAASSKVLLGSLEALLAEAREADRTQVATLSLIGRADLGFLFFCPDLHRLHRWEKRLAALLGRNGWAKTFSFFSMTERSEYTTSEEEHADQLISQEGLVPGSQEFEEKMKSFRERMRHYTEVRLYPTLPDWPFFAFYPMNKKREAGMNWYVLSLAERKELMRGHALVGRRYTGRVVQYVTGSTGLDDWEWGVTLFAHDPYEVKAIVTEMRFDSVSARYGEFGPFYTGLQAPVAEILDRLAV